ncbi:GDP-mannose 4,6-dehydratase [Ramlibacter sp. AW1]|uniref:GDP-mannose 4,6-dehydratase n=1 Tax=Ramlibacter aurantiacus TaxID=2801330 RepID=A0A937D513_9BURK|nr:GDP-mannose 4,6-dehydratase [Ramlibacter aurantiacus]MBL0422270.1 GDP-mannose 4,6-dehydratase [Ramlibacter aurantiacus]
MNLVVTGASGFTGRHLIEAALGRGIKVSALEADVMQRSAVAEELRALAPTHVIHLAAISQVGHPDLKAFYDVNLFGTIHLLEGLCQLPITPQRVVLASSATVYGAHADSPISEDQRSDPSNHYAISKLSMELAARPFADRLPIVIARPFNYTGPGQSTEFLIPKLVEHFYHRAAQLKLGKLDVEREFNDVRFVSEAYIGLLNHGEPGETYNICTGQALTVKHVISVLERLSNHRIALAIEPALVRPNEIRSLYGDPGKLARTVSGLPRFSIEDTLSWMLGAMDS